MDIDSADAICDFKVDYSDHVVSIQMGAVGESDATPYKFSSTVKFGTFATLAAGGTTASGAIAVIPSLIVGLASLITLGSF
jgi:hypothetical protein